MENIWKISRQYNSEVREATFELNRDPYMVLASCDFIRRSLTREDELSSNLKRGIERSLRELEKQATYDLERKGYIPILS